MKGLKKLLPMVLAALLLVMLLPVSADNTVSRYGRQKLGEMTGGADLQYVYDKLVAGCESAREQITIDISGKSIDADKLKTAYKLFYSDYPEYFWVEGGYSASMEEQGQVKTLKVTPEYTITGGALTAAKAAYDAKVNALLSGLSGSDYDKAKTLHDRLIAGVTYEKTANDQNAYGALVEGKAVCNGYTRAYQHLLTKAGIEAWYVPGTSVSPTTGESVGHAWNLVKLDGQWYYTDVTWDDQGENTFYAYFNITTAQLQEGHTVDVDCKTLVPEATATAANFYVKEQRVFTAYDRAKLAALLKKDGNKTQIYIDGNMDAFKAALDADLLNLGGALGATGKYQISYNMTKLGKAMILQVVLLQEGHTHQAASTVAKIEATCMKTGMKEYFVCDCGMKFLDRECTQAVTSTSQLEIRALAHTPSEWKNSDTEHWKLCIVCGTEITNVRAAHSDTNGDKACDVCAYVVDGASTEGTDATTETTDQTSAEQTENQTNPTEESKQENGGNAAPPANDPQQDDMGFDKDILWLVIAGVAVVAAAVVCFGWPLIEKRFKK